MTWLGGVLWWIVFGALLGWVAAWRVGRRSQRLLTEPVLRIVERVVDNPRHIARIASLESDLQRLGGLEVQAAKVPALQARLDELLAAPPRVVEKVVTRTVDRVIEKPVERIVEKPVPDLAALAERDAALHAQRLRVEHLDALAAVLADRVARAAGSAPKAQATAAADRVAADDALRPLRARIEHLEALASVLSGRLAVAAAPSEATKPQPDPLTAGPR
jgi:hypothetical protein